MTSSRAVPPLVDLSTLPPLAAILPQRWPGHPGLEPYQWVVSWCAPSKVLFATGTVKEPCGKASPVSQYSAGVCRANFDEDASLHVIPATTSNRAGGEVAGVVLRSRTIVQNPTRSKWMEVVVRCDPRMPPDTVLLDGNHTVGISTQSASVKLESALDKLYTLRLRSRCACAYGCGLAAALRAVPDTAAERSKATAAGGEEGLMTSPGLFRVANRTVLRGWAHLRLGLPPSSSLEPPPSLAKCLHATSAQTAAVTTTAVHIQATTTTSKRTATTARGAVRGTVTTSEAPVGRGGCSAVGLWCVAASGTRRADVGRCAINRVDPWVQIAAARDNVFSGCKHLGGSGVGVPSTVEGCIAKALTAGANVINYVSDEEAKTFLTTAALPSTSTRITPPYPTVVPSGRQRFGPAGSRAAAEHLATRGARRDTNAMGPPGGRRVSPYGRPFDVGRMLQEWSTESDSVPNARPRGQRGGGTPVSTRSSVRRGASGRASPLANLASSRDHLGDVAHPATTSTSAPSAAVPQKVSAGCYYKRCEPLQLTTFSPGLLPVRLPTDSPFNVFVLNAFFVNATDIASRAGARP